MSKMKNAKKGLIITGIILFLTEGLFILKNYVIWHASGFVWASPLDILLGLPVLPFLMLMWVIPNAIKPIVIGSFVIAPICWLLIGYAIGKWMDKRNKK